MNNLKYGIQDVPKKWYEWIIYPLQQLLAVFVATVLIAKICGTPVSSCLLGACVGTIIYQVITKFKSPMFISSCGATVSAVCGALSLNAAGNNYLMVFCGGLMILIVYAFFAFIVKITGVSTINKFFPPVIVGAITMVIGLNLAPFISTYVKIENGGNWGTIIAIFTMLITALVAHYGKGFMKNIPFLFGIVGGTILSVILTKTNVVKIIDFDNIFTNMQWYPDVTFLKWNFQDFTWTNLGKTALYFVPVAICALLEHLSDHKTLSNIIGTDLTENPGLDKTLLGDGIASAAGTLLCGLPNTSYGESIATTGFSKVASVWVITVAAAALGLMSFIGPVQAIINAIPSCVFGGCAMILYGYIIASGLKTIINNKVDLENNKNLIIVSVILTVGVSGIFLFNDAFSGVALSMVLGIILNLILKEKSDKINYQNNEVNENEENH